MARAKLSGGGDYGPRGERASEKAMQARRVHTRIRAERRGRQRTPLRSGKRCRRKTQGSCDGDSHTTMTQRAAPKDGRGDRYLETLLKGPVEGQLAAVDPCVEGPLCALAGAKEVRAFEGQGQQNRQKKSVSSHELLRHLECSFCSSREKV